MDPLPLAEDIDNIGFRHPASQGLGKEIRRGSIGPVALKLY